MGVEKALGRLFNLLSCAVLRDVDVSGSVGCASKWKSVKSMRLCCRQRAALTVTVPAPSPSIRCHRQTTGSPGWRLRLACQKQETPSQWAVFSFRLGCGGGVVQRPIQRQPEVKRDRWCRAPRPLARLGALRLQRIATTNMTRGRRTRKPEAQSRTAPRPTSKALNEFRPNRGEYLRGKWRRRI